MNAVLLTTPTNPPQKPVNRTSDDGAGAQQPPFGSVLSGQMARQAMQEQHHTANKTATRKEQPPAVAADAPVAPPDGTVALPADLLVNLIQQGQAAGTTTTSDARSAAAPGEVRSSATLPRTTTLPSAPTESAPDMTAAAVTDDSPRPRLTTEPASGVAQRGTDTTALTTAKRDTASDSMIAGVRSSLPDGASTLTTRQEQGHIADAPLPALTGVAQANAAALTTPTAAPAQLSIAPPVGRKDWGDEFGQKVTWLATQHQQSAELHLNPPQLGPLDVVVSVSGDQATAFFSSPHAAVREAVEQAMPKLRELMADNGITLSNTSVSDQSQSTSQDSRQRSSGTRSPGVSDNIAAGEQPSTRVTAPVRRHQGLLDTFA
ncbi:flagellar hook-length control protein FliK [Ferriphaselus sp. R-1]|uniref:flagellar hook-length control protein FliK n=1 Tax=Ferriphaselus sp. R-1 TaxID=1485544 RepID=UPI0006906557|nr:flagellar hook-length control protein FliK [Ferriphaselus sp. R-1]